MAASGRRVAVVTGAAQGFGKAISVALARSGVDILAVDLQTAKETVELIEAAGVRGGALVADVSEATTSQHVSSMLEEHFGRCDILVNNAGIYGQVPFDGVDEALWRRVHAVNLDSQFHMVKAVLPLMKRNRWGRIVNLTSNSVGLPVPGLAHYMASKMGVIGFTRGLSVDVAEFGITVNAVGPTASKTPGGIAGIPNIDQIAQQQAIKRPGKAADIVGTVLFLAGDSSEFVTGQTIMADGGLYRL